MADRSRLVYGGDSIVHLSLNTEYGGLHMNEAQHTVESLVVSVFSELGFQVSE